MSGLVFCVLCGNEIHSFHPRVMINDELLPFHQHCYDEKVEIAVCQNPNCGTETPLQELNYSGVIRLCPKCGGSKFENWIEEKK